MDKMVNMAEASDLSQKQPGSILGVPDMPVPPKYPMSLKIRLENDELAKLGIKDAMPINEEYVLKAKAYVCESESHDTKDGGKDITSYLQITDLELVLASEMKDDNKIQQVASKIYGDQNATLVSSPGEYS